MQTKTDYLDTTLAKEKKSMAAMKASDSARVKTNDKVTKSARACT